MSTLSEIEVAAAALPPQEREELVRVLTQSLLAKGEAQLLHRSRRGFPISKGKIAFTSADVESIESQVDR